MGVFGEREEMEGFFSNELININYALESLAIRIKPIQRGHQHKKSGFPFTRRIGSFSLWGTYVPCPRKMTKLGQKSN